MERADEVWFVEELVPSEAAETAPTKGTFERRERAAGDSVEVRVNKPLSLVLSDPPEGTAFVAADSALVVVRLGVQFAVPLRLHVEALNGTSHLDVSVKAELEVRQQPGRIPLGPREKSFMNRSRPRIVLKRLAL